MARTTIKDIAKRLNINPSTVSRALRDHPDVSVQLKETIRQLADKMGYKPNHMAINLRRGSSHTIGLIIPEIAPFFFPSVIRAVEEATHEKGYNLLILHSNDSIDREIENAEICANMGVDGILVSLSRQSHDIEHFQELMAAGIPIVFFDKIIPGTHAHKVVMPGFQAASLAIEKLLSDHPGSKKVTGFFADSRMSITEDRLQGFRKTMESHGRHIDDSDIVYTDTPESAKQKLIECWNSENRPDAIFAMSDEILSGIIQAVYELGIRIPEDLHLVAISDGQLPLYVPFPIAFVRTSGYELGLAAAGLLFQLIMKMPIVPDTHFLEVELVSNGR
ncbi:LacI family DNA-binding transcriptional regulator [Flavihumibacter stibioxidans]|uniref:substrate-binding domain-containing protein n=1 Tax=Flavihumibacter stibioxidans TaxID=1834163 RepID=UPI00164F2375